MTASRPPPIPERFVATVAAIHGPAGMAWARRLPAILDRAIAGWGLAAGRPYDATYSFVAPVLRDDGSPAVLKAAFPGAPGFAAELALLRLAAGRGLAELYAADPSDGLLLLERIQPGTPLAELVPAADEAATDAAADVMVALRREPPASHPFPTVADWGRGFDRHHARFGGAGPLPAALFSRAERLFAELVETQRDVMVLHGDLHHLNVLAARRARWLAIDPQAVVGEPAFEAAALLRNPPGFGATPDAPRLLARRLDQLGERTGAGRERVRDWGLAQTVLSLVWDVEDFGRTDPASLRCAELLAAL